MHILTIIFRHTSFGDLPTISPRDELQLSIGPATSSSSSEANLSGESLDQSPSPKKFKLFTPYDMSSPRRDQSSDGLKLSSPESSEYDFDKEAFEDDFEVNIDDEEDIEVVKTEVKAEL